MTDDLQALERFVAQIHPEALELTHTLLLQGKSPAIALKEIGVEAGLRAELCYLGLMLGTTELHHAVYRVLAQRNPDHSYPLPPYWNSDLRPVNALFRFGSSSRREDLEVPRDLLRQGDARSISQALLDRAKPLGASGYDFVLAWSLA
ncbi:MAG: hypothetical protein AAGF24_00050 [Cyanobacteria bacterium P01_H01_bin.121]